MTSGPSRSRILCRRAFSALSWRRSNGRTRSKGLLGLQWRSAHGTVGFGAGRSMGGKLGTPAKKGSKCRQRTANPIHRSRIGRGPTRACWPALRRQPAPGTSVASPPARGAREPAQTARSATACTMSRFADCPCSVLRYVLCLTGPPRPRRDRRSRCGAPSSPPSATPGSTGSMPRAGYEGDGMVRGRRGTHRRRRTRARPWRGGFPGHARRAPAAHVAARARLRRLPRPLPAAAGDRKPRHAAARLAVRATRFPPSRRWRTRGTRVASRASSSTCRSRPARRRPPSFCTVHPSSVDAFFAEAQARGVRAIAGKVLMDRHAPRALRDSARTRLRRVEGADRPLARTRAPGLRDHAALRADVDAGAARGRRRAVARASGLLGAIARLRERGRDRVGARALSAGARLRRRVRAGGPARQACHLRPRPPPPRTRARGAARERHGARALPDVEPLPGQRAVPVAAREAGCASAPRGAGHRRGRRDLAVDARHARRGLQGRADGRHLALRGTPLPPRHAGRRAGAGPRRRDRRPAARPGGRLRASSTARRRRCSRSACATRRISTMRCSRCSRWATIVRCARRGWPGAACTGAAKIPRQRADLLRAPAGACDEPGRAPLGEEARPAREAALDYAASAPPRAARNVADGGSPYSER